MTKKEMARNAIKNEIAKVIFGIESLEEQKMDDLDFHDISVMAISVALETAFNAGASFQKENSK